MTNVRKSFLCIASCALIVAATSGTAFAEGVPAGTIIENTATATYEDGNATRTIGSNTVAIKVDELLDVAVSSLDSAAITATAGLEVLTFEVTNTGNGPEAFNLSTNVAVAGNDFDSSLNGIAIDSNNNGQYDPGVDTILTGPETTAIIAPDENVTVFVLVTVPDTVVDGNQSDVELIAEAATGHGAAGTNFIGEGEGGGDAVVGTGGARAVASGSLQVNVAGVTLTKSATIIDQFGGTTAVPGAVISYTIIANVEGTGTVNNLIVSDNIPDGTTYAPGTLSYDSTALTDASGDDAGEGSAAGITVNLGSVNSGASHSITFNVTIND